MSQEAEDYYALTVSIYASEEIQQKAKQGEHWNEHKTSYRHRTRRHAL